MNTSALLLAAEGEAQNPLLPAIYDIVWSIIPFALVLFLFWRIVLPRLQKTLDERSSAIEGGIAQAETAQAEAKVALEKYNKLLADARAEAAEIRDLARTEGAVILAEMKDNAQAEANRIAATAKTQIEAERHQAVLSLRKEVGALALDLAAAVVQERLSEDAKAASVVDKLLADLDREQAAPKKAAATKAPAKKAPAKKAAK
jgi:F-type H+-transporting ATPase subunit b